MIFTIVSFLLCAICAWFMALDEEKREKREMREMAWKFLALAAVAELKKRDEEGRKDGEQGREADQPVGSSAGRCEDVSG